MRRAHTKLLLHHETCLFQRCGDIFNARDGSEEGTYHAPLFSQEENVSAYFFIFETIQSTLFPVSRDDCKEFTLNVSPPYSTGTLQNAPPYS